MQRIITPRLIPALVALAFSGSASAAGFQLIEQNASGIGNRPKIIQFKGLKVPTWPSAAIGNPFPTMSVHKGNLPDFNDSLSKFFNG